MSSIQYVPLGDQGFRCTIVTKENEATSHVEAGHIELAIKDVASDAEPLLDGDERFMSNSSLVANLLNYGVSEYAKLRVEHAEKRKEFRKAADLHSRAALQLAIYASLDSYQTRRGWCSCCFEQTEHRIVDGKFLPQVCLCKNCGDATTPCMAAGCRHMARRPYGSVQLSSSAP